MDEMVMRAMAKWPTVPVCRGWLGLDQRGDWYLRDDAAQAAGAFGTDDPANRMLARGSRLTHDKLIGFIGRNYAADERGQWFFQNGPQRVFVELQLAPWIWRVTDSMSAKVCSHTGAEVHAVAVLLDEFGHVYLETELGLGLVHSQDVWRAASAIEAGVFAQPEAVRRADLPQRYGFVLSPASLAQSESKQSNNR